MKILLTVEFYYAAGGGGIAEQARQIAETLSRLGHRVVVATGSCFGRPKNIKGVEIREFLVSGNFVKGIRGDVGEYKNFLLAQDYDALLNFAANVWTTDIALEISEKISKKKILSTPGLSRLGSAKYDAYYKKFYAKKLKNYDAIVYASASYRDKIFGDENGLSAKAVVIPNGASEEEFLKKPEQDFRKKHGIRSKYLAISVANHYFAKGHGFVISAWKKIKDMDLSLAIIGSPPARRGWFSCYYSCLGKSALRKNLFVVRPDSREEVLSAYSQADLFLFGSKLECAPLVMYESFASKTPFISTKVGNVADYERFVELADSKEQMAQKAKALLLDEQRRDKMTKEAYDFWLKERTWSSIAKKYDEVLNKK